VETHDVVLEIGPGRGVLTRSLLAKAKKVIAVEKDDALIEYLRDTFKKEIAEKKLLLIHDDILTWKPVRKEIRAGSYKIVANIPYYITGLLLRHFLSMKEHPSQMTLLVQKEVAERIIAKNAKESMLSISVKAYGIPRYIETVKARFFSPPPKVDSAIITIENISKSLFDAIDEKQFFHLVSKSFAHKRKQLATNLALAFGHTYHVEELFAACGLHPNIRAEDLSLASWKCLAQQVKTLKDSFQPQK